ncbi:MAG: hypothetical protein KC933_21355 [Myxococcales bacterium]|nr:hypothetical protein [Myxococcales bacterium]
MKRILALLPFALLGVACGEPSPVVVGHVEGASLTQALVAAHDDDALDTRYDLGGPSIVITVNGEDRRVRLDADGVFVMQDLPTGDITFTLESDRFRGSITIKDVQPAETVDLSLSLDGTGILMQVTRREVREPRSLPDAAGPIRIDGNNVIYHLDARTYEGDIEIRGNNVTLVGPRSEDCNQEAMAVVTGDLLVTGNNVRIIDVLVLGQVDIRGQGVRRHQLCSR